MARTNVTDVRVTVYDTAIAAIARGPEVYDFVRKIVDGAAEGMRGGAPVRTGAGRASIGGRVVMGADGWYGVASWDTRHYYMGIQNARQSFVEPAFSRVRFV